MYVATVPNRNSPPAILLRESFRLNGKVRNRTLANLSHWPPAQVDAMRAVLKGATSVGAPLPQAFDIVRSRPHGHVAAVLGTLHRLHLDTLIDKHSSRELYLVVAMIVARVLEPASKLATSRALHPDTLTSTLSELLHLDAPSEDELYAAMDWLLPQQARIEQVLAKRHLAEESLVLYDLTSTYFEGRHCPLAKLGHSRDDKKGKLQVVFGLMTNGEGCPVAVEVYAGNTSDPKTVSDQVTKLRQRFGLQRVILVGDRGMITSARIRENLQPAPGIEWITALRAPAIKKLASDGVLQLSLFDNRDLAEITHPDFPGERLIACFNPLLAEERARKRPELLTATEKELEKIAVATRRKKRPLRGKQNIGLRVGKVLNRYKMGKHFQIEIQEDSFSYQRRQANIEKEKSLDGIYVIRTNVSPEVFSSEQAVRNYKSLSGVERAFRSLKTVDLHVRPIHHREPDRVRAHIFLCMLAYYVEWHMRQDLAPLLFDDDDKAAAEQARTSVVAPAQRSASAQQKASSRRTPDDLPVHSFQTLLSDLATIVANRVQPKDAAIPAFDIITTPTAVQQRALDLLRVAIKFPNV
ncbi:MAG TPA: IS1634 family transposase [Candidatus Limnocylindrales bacterium]|nr:IS1634 family transposase [Candidatus Limnocylindrales bacterium]